MQIKGNMNFWEDLGKTLRLDTVNILPKNNMKSSSNHKTPQVGRIHKNYQVQFLNTQPF